MKNYFTETAVIKGTLSIPRSSSPWKKVRIRALHNEQGTYYQLAFSDEKKEFHKNMQPDAVWTTLEPLLAHFKQGVFYTKEKKAELFVNRRGLVQTRWFPHDQELTPSAHNKEKARQLSQQNPLPFLQALGIQRADGSIKVDKKDKFSQINRFLDLVAPHLEEAKSIVDLGCGRGYLTFSLAHLLKEQTTKIVGIDYQKELIQEMNELAEKLHMPHLTFVKEKIENYHPETPPDLVISLHACNTATDEAIFQAIQWEAKVVLIAPCCHQEIYKQISSQELAPLLRHGILKERLSSLVTDAARAEILTQMGYKTDVIEFVDTEHTPKNILIRAMKTGKSRGLTNRYKQFCQTLNIRPRLETLLFSEEEPL